MPTSGSHTTTTGNATKPALPPQHSATSNTTTNLLQKQPSLPSQRPTLSKPHIAPASLNGGHHHGSRSHSGSGILRTWVLLLISVVLTMILSIFPEPRQMMYETEQQMEKVVYETEQQLERDVMEYWLSSKQFYTADTSDTTNTMYDADVRMRQQQSPPSSSSTWVDGEKKLKRALQALVERQQRGLDVGVPVLTRYLGDDLPAFYSTDDPSLNHGIATVDEWHRRIQEKYTAMRNEENRWREIVTNTLLSERG